MTIDEAEQRRHEQDASGSEGSVICQEGLWLKSSPSVMLNNAGTSRMRVTVKKAAVKEAPFLQKH